MFLHLNAENWANNTHIALVLKVEPMMVKGTIDKCLSAKMSSRLNVEICTKDDEGY